MPTARGRAARVGLCLILAVSACGDGSGPTGAGGDSVGGGDADSGDDDLCAGASPSGQSTTDTQRDASVNQTETTVIFTTLGCLGVPTELTFRVSMTNHSCSIPGYNLDLEQHAELRNSDGLLVTSGFAYDVLSADDHHPLGILTVPSDVGGSPLIGCSTASLTLAISGIDQPDTESIEFTWAGAVLDGSRNCP